MTKNLKNVRDLHRLITYLLDKYLLCNVGQKPVEIFLVLRIDEPIVKHAQRLVAEKFEESFLLGEFIDLKPHRLPCKYNYYVILNSFKQKKIYYRYVKNFF